MTRSIHHSLSGFFWALIVLGLFLLAAYVSLGRLAVSNLERYQQPILEELNLRVPFNIEAQQVRGEWRYFTPVVVLSQLRISLPESPQSPLELTEGQVGIDVWSTLLSGSLQITHLVVDGLSLQAEYSSDGKIRLRGFSQGQGESSAWLQEFLLNARDIRLRDNVLQMRLPSGEVRNLDLNLVLSRSGSFRRMEADLSSTRGAVIRVLSKGVGSPFRPESFSGDAYVHIRSTDLGAMRAMFAVNPPAIWAEGETEIEVWMNWDRGTPRIVTEVESSSLRVSAIDGDWALPLEKIFLQAHVLEEDGRWTLNAAGVEVAARGEAITLPRLQIDIWGSTVQFKARDLDLQSLANFAATMETGEDGFESLLDDLSPAGRISALQVDVADFSQPAVGWEVEANFEDVYVAPLGGAPGGRSATGFANLRPGGGKVVLDSRNLELDFPQIYQQPLPFEAIFGTLDIRWDDDAVRLSSGLIQAVTTEGEVNALFGLNIPRWDDGIGVAMDLMVGLQDADPIARHKYVPYTLSEGLLGWLEDSIGEGHIEEGAFLWRGALRSGADNLRTVQLGFNIEDTEITYHPDWPSVKANDGVIVIDEADVSVWVNQGVLLGSRLRDISVETGLNKQKNVTLAVAAKMQGPAADGLHVVNHSPLRDVVGEVFAEWEIAGQLETQLKLNMILAEGAAPPQVDVRTDWKDVDLMIMPGALVVKQIGGVAEYSTTKGFRAKDLSGTLWGEKVSLTLRQDNAASDGRYDAKASVLVLDAKSRVAVSALQEWLKLDVLALAKGTTPVDVTMRVVPGEGVTLYADSALEGVALNLPAPWQKTADSTASFRLSYDMDPAAQTILLHLDDQLLLSLGLRDGALYTGGLGIAAATPTLQEGVFTIEGHAPQLDVAACAEFVTEYLGDFSSTVESADTAFAASDDKQVPISIAVSNLKVDELLLAGQTFRNVAVNAVVDAGSLQLSLETQWLRGSLARESEQAPIQIDIEQFDLGQMPEIGESAQSGVRQASTTFDIPPLEIKIKNLLRSQKRLGEISFALETNGDALLFSDIYGSVAGVTIREEVPAQLRWQSGEEGRTTLKADIYFGDLGATLAQVGYEKIIQTKRGSLAMDLNWPGAPWEFALIDGAGSLLLDVGKGSFLSAPSGAAGALRVVNILNLVYIVQSLSVTHMFDSGIPFDSVKGEVYLHEGTIEVPRIKVAGGSTFSFSGVSDVASQSLNGELVATLPVAKNLPWVAALAASVPVAAGVFVVSKIFDKQVNKLSSAVYSIEGSWDEPKVSFSRIFDDASPALPGRVQATPADPNSVPDVVAVPDPNGVTELSALPDPNDQLLEDDLQIDDLPDPNAAQATDESIPAQ